MDGEYTVWATMHRNYHDEAGQRGEEDRFFIGDTDFIKESSVAVKTIIAFFSSKYCPENADLANALGGYASLREAEKILLKNKEQCFKNIAIPKQTQYDEYPAHFILKIETEGTSAFVTVNLQALWGSGVGSYHFEIKKNGKFKYIEL